ncbi:MAG: hypothetical protein HY015_10385 [Bacteroidetes bacterium]|nr:hypothetical protein [Bacteroidota bacterium]
MKIGFAILHFSLIFFFTYLFAKRWNTIGSKLFWSAFIYHLVAGMFVGLVYLFYYSANDTWLFFEDAKRLSSIAHTNFPAYIKLLFDFSDNLNAGLVNEDFRSLLFIKILSALCFFSWDNYWVCTGYFSLLSFIASWFLHRKITGHFQNSTSCSALSFLFFPSVVFWSSGIEKETLTLASLYFLAGIFLQLIFHKKIDKFVLVMVFLACVLLWALKYYWAGVFLISALAAFVVEHLSLKLLVIKRHLILVYIFAFALIGVSVSFLHPNFYLHRFLEVVVSNHDEFIPLSADNNLVHFYQLSPTVTSVIINSPWALVSGIFRPFIGEGQGLLGLFASVENFLTLILFISFAWNFKNHFHEPINILFLAVVSYCIMLCIFLALSTPNLGTLSRYRVGFLPFLVFVFAYRNPLFDSAVKKFLN